MALTGPVAAHFERQAEACDRLGSPFTARLCRLLIDILAENTGTGRRVTGWPGDTGADALALRLCGGLHGLVLAGRSEKLAAVYPPNDADDERLGEALQAAITHHDAALTEALGSAPQTNEIARSAMLLPGFLTIARETGLKLALCEIGSSAGLNLNFDRFHYAYGEQQWGDASSPVRLSPETHGTVPLEGKVEIVARAGCDIAPIDNGDQAQRLRLRSYVWADQPARMERLDAAMAVAARTPFELRQADAADFLRDRLASRPGNAAFVLFHSIMWQYMPRGTKDAILAALEEAGAKASAAAPIARLRMEPLGPKEAYATLSLTMWPGGETRRLAKCDFHGRWIEWIG